MPRRSAADVAASRSAAVEAGVAPAPVEGLEGVTIGRPAGQRALSKSGLIGRCGDKEAMQRAVLAAAVERFTAAVWRPAEHATPGLPRLEAIVDAWIAHLRDGVFPGGCFVTTASVEYDARPGPLRDDVRAAVKRWLAVLGRGRRHAPAAGTLPPAPGPAAGAFGLPSPPPGGAVAGRVTGDARALDRTRAAMRRAIGLYSSD